MVLRKFAAALLLSMMPLSQVQAEVVTGTTERWCERSNDLVFTALNLPHPSSMSLYWEVQPRENGGRVMWLIPNTGTLLSRVRGLTSLATVRDAASYSYSSQAIADLRPGDVVFMRHAQESYYAAFQVNEILKAPEGACPLLDWQLGGRWYFQTSGNADFSSYVPQGS